jgi:hypothetical protein
MAISRMNVVVLAALTASLSLAPLRAADAVAEELVGKMLATQRTSGVTLRIRLAVTRPSGERPAVMQLRVHSRHDGDVARWRYQVLWPAARRGQALCLEKAGTGAATGFLFEPPDKVTPLTPELLAGRYLDSDLSIEDLTEDFWHWPGPVVSGTETVDREACTLLDFRPPAEHDAAGSLVRVWLAPAKMIPMRIEKIGSEGRLVRRFIFQKAIQHDGIWTPTAMTVQVPGGATETTLGISRGKRDVEIPLEEFSIESVRRFAKVLEQEAAEAESRSGRPGHN